MFSGLYNVELREWIKELENKHRAYTRKTYPLLCKFFNLTENFTEEELYKAFRKMRVKYHPDQPNGDIEMFMQVREKYDELKGMMTVYKKNN